MARPTLDTAVDPATARPRAIPPPAMRSPARRGRRRNGRWVGWLFVAPALAVYAVFVLWPIYVTFEYSFYRWDGIGPSTWVGLANYTKVFTDPQLFDTILNAFKLIIFFSIIPVLLG